MKKSDDKCHEDQHEEDQRKTSKLMAYLSIKSENCKHETCNALSNSQIGIHKTQMFIVLYLSELLQIK